ncbi:hypothetical protein JCM19241_28 [Vibrio ishigakensis]|uniref:Uncharacterized protein n=1 Tax=Vibrio ishigakensis TaxID=1481914 RepID=A0A0B8QXA8_9VIBR|nr:hypothetical protein JCM19241_28 [Vibrio ishigakensis]
MIVGGTAGLALLLNQFVDLSFGTLYFLVNVPSISWLGFAWQTLHH